MTCPTDSLPRHKDDFDRVYDLEDPSPYYTALRPSDYRMPAVLAGALKAMHGPMCAARGAGGTLRVLDFACGYGAIGLRGSLWSTLPPWDFSIGSFTRTSPTGLRAGS